MLFSPKDFCSSRVYLYNLEWISHARFFVINRGKTIQEHNYYTVEDKLALIIHFFNWIFEDFSKQTCKRWQRTWWEDIVFENHRPSSITPRTVACY